MGLLSSSDERGSFKIRARISPSTSLKRLCTIQKPWTYSDMFLYFSKPRFTLTNILNKENRLLTGFSPNQLVDVEIVEEHIPAL